MKSFFSKHSYSMVKMLLNQIATAIFGFVLALASAKAESVALRNATSIGAILFYLFLLYTMTWDIGFADKVSVESGRIKRNIFTGAYISFVANSLNFIFAFFIMMAHLVQGSTLIGNIGGICSFLALLFEGMFTGILTNPVGGEALNSYWFVYFLLPLPAMLTCFLAYNMGLRDIRIFGSLSADAIAKKKKDKDAR